MRKVSGSNLGRANGSPEVFRVLLQFLQANAGTVAPFHHNSFLPSPFRFITNHYIIRNYFILDTDSVVK
jgi:hypothetical protein